MPVTIQARRVRADGIVDPLDPRLGRQLIEQQQGFPAQFSLIRSRSVEGPDSDAVGRVDHLINDGVGKRTAGQIA